MSVATSDVAAELGVAEPAFDTPQWRQWEMWILDAQMLVEDAARLRGVALDSIDSRKVDRVVRLLVAGAVRNPDGASSVTESVTSDDTTASNTRQFSRMHRPGLALNDDLIAELFGRPFSSGFGSIRLGVPSWRVPREGA